MKLFKGLMILGLVGFPLLGQEEAAPPAQVETIDENRIRVGEVIIDKKSREIRFPAEVNMREGLLELAVVHVNGKIHESLFMTNTRPINLNIGLKLMGYPESKELYEILDEEYRPTGKFYEVAEDVREKARMDIFVEWEEGEKIKRTSLNDLIYHEVLEKPMPSGPWLYGGSYMLRERFKAEISGDIVGIYVFRSALINYPGPDRNSDEVWIPNARVVPAVGTKVTIVIAERKE